MSEATDLGALYRETRARLAELICGLDAADLGTRVPACPEWTVRDVLAHLVSIPEDAAAGRLTGIPTEEFTAQQVARFAGLPVPEILARWAASAPDFEQAVAAREVWPAVIDLATHEQDVRGAVGQPGARDCAAIRQGIERLLTSIESPVRLRITTEDGTYLAGPEVGAESTDGPLTLSTTRFEAFRWRMGRRSLAQLAAMTWSAEPPEGLLRQLAIFGPAATDVRE